MSVFFIQVIDGLAVGAIYGLLAMAIVLVYRATKVINVAQAEFATLSTFFAWQLYTWGVNIWLAILCAVILSFLIGALTERLIIRWTEDSDHLTSIVVTIGLMLIINQATGWFWGSDLKVFPNVFGEGIISLGNLQVSFATVGTISVLIIIAILFQIFFSKTKVGLGMRAVAEHRQWGRLAGIPASRMLMLGWGLSLAVGSLAGVIAAPSFYLEPNMLLGAGLYAFAAAALGGFDSLSGAIVGGLAVGVIENLAGNYISFIGSDLKILVPLTLMFFVLLTRPSGLFGTKEVSRV